MRPDILSNLYVVKQFLNQTTPDNDFILDLLMDNVLGEIEGDANRSIKLQRFTEVRNWESAIMLRESPVMNIASVTGGATGLTFDDDYKIDLSRGMLYPYSMGDASSLLNAMNIVYDAGYFEAHVHVGNNKIDFEETTGVEKTAEIAVGMYKTPSTDGSTYIKSPATLLAEAIQTAMNAAGDSVYTVSYDITSAKFTLASDLAGGAGIFNLPWSTGSHSSQSSGELLGYDVTEDDTGASSYTSDVNDDCAPSDLRALFLNMTRIAWERYNHENLLANVSSERIPDGSSITYKYTFDISKIMPSYDRILNRYKRLIIG